MKHTIICLLLLVGISYNLQAQDKIVLRNGRTIEVKIHRSNEGSVEYTYPGETSIYERQKAGISYILYEDGRREVCDESLRATERAATNRTTTTTTPNRTETNRQQASSTRNVISNNEEIYWQDVKTTFTDVEVRGMRRINRVSAVSNISYKDAIQQLKMKTAAIGGTTVLVMDDLDDNMGDEIEVLGIAYRDETMEYTPRNANQQTNIPVESSANERRRRIAQQMDGYHNESSLIFEDPSSRSNTQQQASPRNNSASSRQNNDFSSSSDEDAIYLLNGRVIRGTIEEIEPDDFVSIRTTTGRINEYSMDDVRRITRATTPPPRNSRAQDRNASSRNSSRNNSNNNDRYNNRSSSGYNDYSIVGYKGTFDVGYNLAMGGTGEKGSFEFNTSHGYQLNEYLFVGAGVGLHMYNARDAQLKTNMGSADKFPQYVPRYGSSSTTLNDSVTYMRAVDSTYMTLPIFLDIRGYYPLQNSAITPFAMLRVGYSFNLSDGFGGMGLYMNPAVGVKYQVTPMIGINFSIGYAFQSYGGIPIPKDGSKGGYGYYYYKDAAGKTNGVKYEAKGAGSISLKLGVEF